MGSKGARTQRVSVDLPPPKPTFTPWHIAADFAASGTVACLVMWAIASLAGWSVPLALSGAIVSSGLATAGRMAARQAIYRYRWGDPD